MSQEKPPETPEETEASFYVRAIRLKEERDAAEVRRKQAHKEAAQWEVRALTAESALMDFEASLDKESTGRA